MWIEIGGYIIGALIAAGVRGGIRDEMDGIGDRLFILFWPIVLVCWVIYRIAAVFVQLGIMIKRRST